MMDFNVVEESVKVVDCVFELLLTDDKGVKGNADNAFETLSQIKTDLVFHNPEDRKEYKKRHQLMQVVDTLIGAINNDTTEVEMKKYVLNLYKVFCMNMFN